MMKRIGFGFIRLLLLAVGIGVIVFLGRMAAAGISDVLEQANTRRLYSERGANFPADATVIAQDNQQISAQKTAAPFVANTDPAAANQTLSTNAQQTAEAPSASPTVEPTQEPSNTPTTQATETATTSPTATEPPTLPPTATPTIPPTSTRVVQVATLPPTNTKRAAEVAAPTATIAPTQTRVPPTTAPTVTPTQPRQAPNVTRTPSKAATGNAATGPTVQPTGRLPTIIPVAERTERPQPTGIPTRAPRVRSNNNDIMNVLLIGSDREDDPSAADFRTDSMLIVSINRTTGSVSMLSIPRDLYVYIPSQGMQRINTAFSRGDLIKWNPGGGFGLLQQTILWNMGIPIHYYAMVEYSSFKSIVDTIGGVEVAVDCPITDLRFQGKYDDKKNPIYEPYTLNPGYYKMDGSLALWYARMRKSSSDFDRGRRQQQLARAIWRTARDQGLLTKAPELWGTMTGFMKTNLPFGDTVSMVPLALNLKPGDISSYYMFKEIQTQHFKAPDGDVQIPLPSGFFKMINDFYTPRTANRLGSQAPSVEIVNASGSADWDKIAADKLGSEGFEGQAKGGIDAVDKTVVYDYTGNAKPGITTSLIKTLGLKPTQVVSQPDPNRTVDFKVVLGRDFKTCTALGFGS